jgi:hypothetical protein
MLNIVESIAYDIARFNVAPAFLRPKGIFQYANVPQGQRKWSFADLLSGSEYDCNWKIHP